MSIAAEHADSIAPAVTVLLLLGGGTIFSFGYAVAVMHRANTDYKGAKEGLPGLRKGYWTSWWASVKRGALIVCGLAFLVAWMITSADDDTEPAPVPTPSLTRHR